MSKNDWKVFICHATEDKKDFVKQLADEFIKNDLNIFYDDYSILFGDEIDKEVFEELRRTKYVVAIISENFLNKPYPLMELGAIISMKYGGSDILLIPLCYNIGIETVRERLSIISKLKSILYVKDNYDINKVVLAINQRIIEYEKELQEKNLKGVDEHQISYNLKNILEPIDYYDDIFNRLKYFTGREWLIEKIDHWLKDYSGINRVLLLTGAPGTGKSSMAAWLSENRKEVSAIHFCVHRNEEKNNPLRIIRSISYQLSTKLSGYSNVLMELNVPEIIKNYHDPTTLFSKLIVQPLWKVAIPDRSIVILIDALDESSKNGNNELVTFIANEFDKTPPWLKLFITSRPNPEVMLPLQKFSTITIDTSCSENYNDIKSYLHQQLSPHLKGVELSTNHEIIDKIAYKSEGIFQYARCICEEVVLGHYKLSDVESFPKSLGSIYLNYFERQFSNIDYYQKHIRGIIATIISVREPLHTGLLKQIYSISNADFYSIHVAFGSMFELRSSGSNETIQLQHLSYFEWLNSYEKSGPYCIELSDGFTKLADHGLIEYQRNKVDGRSAMHVHFLKWLPSYLAETNRYKELKDILLDPTFTTNKIELGYTHLLFSDFSKLLTLAERHKDFENYHQIMVALLLCHKHASDFNFELLAGMFESKTNIDTESLKSVISSYNPRNRAILNMLTLHEVLFNENVTSENKDNIVKWILEEIKVESKKNNYLRNAFPQRYILRLCKVLEKAGFSFDFFIECFFDTKNEYYERIDFISIESIVSKYDLNYEENKYLYDPERFKVEKNSVIYLILMILFVLILYLIFFIIRIPLIISSILFYINRCISYIPRKVCYFFISLLNVSYERKISIVNGIYSRIISTIAKLFFRLAVLLEIRSAIFKSVDIEYYNIIKELTVRFKLRILINLLPQKNRIKLDTGILYNLEKSNTRKNSIYIDRFLAKVEKKYNINDNIYAIMIVLFNNIYVIDVDNNHYLNKVLKYFEQIDSNQNGILKKCLAAIPINYYSKPFVQQLIRRTLVFENIKCIKMISLANVRNYNNFPKINKQLESLFKSIEDNKWKQNILGERGRMGFIERIDWSLLTSYFALVDIQEFFKFKSYEIYRFENSEIDHTLKTLDFFIDNYELIDVDDITMSFPEFAGMSNNEEFDNSIDDEMFKEYLENNRIEEVIQLYSVIDKKVKYHEDVYLNLVFLDSLKHLSIDAFFETVTNSKILLDLGIPTIDKVNQRFIRKIFSNQENIEEYLFKYSASQTHNSDISMRLLYSYAAYTAFASPYKKYQKKQLLKEMSEVLKVEDWINAVS